MKLVVNGKRKTHIKQDMEFLKGRDLNPIGILTGTEPAEKAR